LRWINRANGWLKFNTSNRELIDLMG